MFKLLSLSVRPRIHLILKTIAPTMSVSTVKRNTLNPVLVSRQSSSVRQHIAILATSLHAFSLRCMVSDSSIHFISLNLVVHH